MFPLAVSGLSVVACMAPPTVWAVVGAAAFGAFAPTVLLPIINGMGESATGARRESQEEQQPSQRSVVEELSLTMDKAIRDAYAWCDASRTLGMEVIITFIVVFGLVFLLHQVYQHRLRGGQGKKGSGEEPGGQAPGDMPEEPVPMYPPLTETVRDVLERCVDQAAANVGGTAGQAPRDMPEQPVPMRPALEQAVQDVLGRCVDQAAAASVGQPTVRGIYKHVEDGERFYMIIDKNLSVEAKICNMASFMQRKNPRSLYVMTVFPNGRVCAWSEATPDKQ